MLQAIYARISENPNYLSESLTFYRGFTLEERLAFPKLVEAITQKVNADDAPTSDIEDID